MPWGRKRVCAPWVWQWMIQSATREIATAVQWESPHLCASPFRPPKVTLGLE